MARRKGRKEWDGITREEWLSLFADPDVMSDLVMRICSALFHSPRYEGRAKNIAAAMDVEYRALNAAVGWAGMKIRARREEAGKEINGPAVPWEYVFDGAEDEDGTYLWILKPAAAAAWRELEEADWPERQAVEEILSEDTSSFGREGSLFAARPPDTVDRIRQRLNEARLFQRRALSGGSRCTVCGLSRPSLLRAVPYGAAGEKHRGLLFCPSHGALFAAHLITFGPRGDLLVADSLSEEDRVALGLAAGMKAKNPFSGRRMAVHRRIFHGGRKNP